MSERKRILSIAIDNDLLKRLKDLSQEKELSVSKLVTQLIEEALYLEENVFSDEIYKNIDWLSNEWKDKLQVLFTKVLDTTPDPIWIKDLNLRFVYVNQAFADLFGHKKEEIIGKNDIEFLPPEVAKQCIYSDMQALEKRESSHSIETVEKDGETLYFDVIKTPLFDRLGRPIAILGISRDITGFIKTKEELEKKNQEILEAYKKLKEIYNIDAVTGVATKNRFLKNLKNIYEKAEHGDKIILVLFDIDNFRYINEVYGSKFGDTVLSRTAKMVKSFMETFDADFSVGRLGDDLFGIVIKKDIDEQILIENLKDVISSIKLNTPKYSSFFSPKATYIATSIYKQVGKEPDFEEMLSTLEIHLEKLKYVERKDHKILDLKKDMSKYAVGDKELENLLDEAIKKGEIYPFLQPIVNLSTKERIGYELLSKIKNKKGEYIEAEKFIHLAFRTGHIALIDQIVLKVVKEEIYPEIKDRNVLFLNLSPFTLYKVENIGNTIAQDILSIRDRTVFEISEADVLRNIKDLRDIKRSFGLQFAIDSFGTASSSIKDLIDLGEEGIISYVKLAKLITENLDKYPWKRKFVKSIKAISDEMGIKVIAKNIEKPEDLNILQDIGIEYAQGDYIEKSELFTPEKKKERIFD
jgi:PAS domain S-box-containing protein/diguanylate cyclase (GGDEF)-like protein